MALNCQFFFDASVIVPAFLSTVNATSLHFFPVIVFTRMGNECRLIVYKSLSSKMLIYVLHDMVNTRTFIEHSSTVSVYS